jgi:hypothetical protein
VIAMAVGMMAHDAWRTRAVILPKAATSAADG